jgi:hypothetical protein
MIFCFTLLCYVICMVSTSSALLHTIEGLKENEHRLEEEEKTGACGCMKSCIGEDLERNPADYPGIKISQ